MSPYYDRVAHEEKLVNKLIIEKIQLALEARGRVQRKLYLSNELQAI